MSAAADEGSLLEVENLVTEYPLARRLGGVRLRRARDVTRAVDGVSLAVKSGQLVALVGESGCGKTTVAQSVMRMVPTSSGSIRFQGTELTALSSRELRPIRRDIQLIYQDPYDALDTRFRVRQTVAEPLQIHHAPRAERDGRVADALAAAGLTPPSLYLDRFPHELSGGQRQRVAIAAALILRPKLLIADEPVSMLDVSIRAGILNLFEQLRRDGLGILMITHDLSTAAQYADHIAVMYLGRIVEEGPALEVINNPQHPYTQALISVAPNRDPRQRRERQVLRGELPNALAIPSGCRFHARCPAKIECCESIDPSLWDAGTASSHRAACVHVSQAVGDLPRTSVEKGLLEDVI